MSDAAPAPLRRGRDNLVSSGITQAKLNGQVYTPLDLARSVVAQLRWPAVAGLALDPSCGDGVFLQALVERACADGVPERVSEIVGIDVDPVALEAARLRLDTLCEERGIAERPQLRHADALDGLPDSATIVGNPPYLEAKRMPSALKARIKAELPVAGRGAFDLYGAFIALALNTLPEHGELAFVVPNRIAVTSSTKALRARLLTRQVALVDLSTERVFADAAVYPVVLWSRPGAPHFSVEDADGQRLLSLPAASIVRLDGRFPLPSAAMLPMVERLLADPTRYPPLSASVTVRWTVSFHKAGLRDRYVFDAKPDTAHARRFLGGMRFSGNREVGALSVDWAGAWIDYDEDRARSDKNPLPPAALFDEPVVAIPQNARRPRAVLLPERFVLKDTFLAGVGSPEALRWLVLVLNSAVFHHLYEALYGGTRKGGGYLHLLGSYLHPVPLPPAPSGASALHDQRVAAPDDLALVAECEAMVRAAYGLTDAEAAVLDELVLPDA